MTSVFLAESCQGDQKTLNAWRRVGRRLWRKLRSASDCCFLLPVFTLYTSLCGIITCPIPIFQPYTQKPFPSFWGSHHQYLRESIFRTRWSSGLNTISNFVFMLLDASNRRFVYTTMASARTTGHSSVHQHVLLARAHPRGRGGKGDAGLQPPPNPQNRSLRNTDFADIMM
jgi:hypothetical protein